MQLFDDRGAQQGRVIENGLLGDDESVVHTDRAGQLLRDQRVHRAVTRLQGVQRRDSATLLGQELRLSGERLGIDDALVGVRQDGVILDQPLVGLLEPLVRGEQRLRRQGHGGLGRIQVLSELDCGLAVPGDGAAGRCLQDEALIGLEYCGAGRLRVVLVHGREHGADGVTDGRLYVPVGYHWSSCISMVTFSVRLPLALIILMR